MQEFKNIRKLKVTAAFNFVFQQGVERTYQKGMSPSKFDIIDAVH
jgi:hypothetical protein